MISRQTHLAEEYIVELDDLRTEAEHLNWFLEFYKHPHSTELAKILDRFIDSDSAAYRHVDPQAAIPITRIQARQERAEKIKDLILDPHSRKKWIDNRIGFLIKALQDMDESPRDRRFRLKPSLSELEERTTNAAD